MGRSRGQEKREGRTREGSREVEEKGSKEEEEEAVGGGKEGVQEERGCK